MIRCVFFGYNPFFLFDFLFDSLKHVRIRTVEWCIRLESGYCKTKSYSCKYCSGQFWSKQIKCKKNVPPTTLLWPSQPVTGPGPVPGNMWGISIAHASQIWQALLSPKRIPTAQVRGQGPVPVTAIELFSQTRAKDAEALVRMSHSFDRPGLGTFTSFLLPLILGMCLLCVCTCVLCVCYVCAVGKKLGH